MSSKVGRPKADNPKCNDVKVRVDNHTLEKLDEYCKKHGVTRAEAIREGINLLFDKK